jgi:spore coat protein U-like protein
MSCTVLAISELAFGRYSARQSSPVDALAYVTFSCTDVGPADVLAIEITRGRGGTFNRRLRDGKQSLQYNLYVNAARTRVWGDGSSGTSVQRVRPPNNRPMTLPIFGRVPAGQRARPGAYSDSVFVSLVF